MPSWGPWDLLQLPEGAVGPQGAGDGGAPLLADGVLPKAGQRHRAGEERPRQGIGCSPTAPLAPRSGAETIYCNGQSV